MVNRPNVSEPFGDRTYFNPRHGARFLPVLFRYGSSRRFECATGAGIPPPPRNAP